MGTTIDEASEPDTELQHRAGDKIDRSETEAVRGRYDRIAPVYDAMEWLAEFRFSRWRADQWSRVEGKHILELGVGTGKNIPYYPDDRQITAIDIAPKMLERARRRAESGRGQLFVTSPGRDSPDCPQSTWARERLRTASRFDFLSVRIMTACSSSTISNESSSRYSGHDSIPF